MTLLADVIFPAFAAPYLARLTLPAGISAIVAEIAVFCVFNRHLTLRKIFFVVMLANVVSGVIGFILAFVLPDGLVPTVGGRPWQSVEAGPQFGTYVILSFFVAFVLSVIIEYAVVRLCVIYARVDKPLVTVSLTNVVSYVTLAGLWFVFARS